MLITVIIPIHNCTKEYLNICLQSIFAQENVNVEIVCIDDGSTNGIISEIEKIFVDRDDAILIRTEHLGVSHARNLGIRKASGKYITFMDADDFYPENDVLEKLINCA